MFEQGAAVPRFIKSERGQDLDVGSGDDVISHGVGGGLSSKGCEWGLW